jgi:excisionase family DNA binding protein
MDIDEHLTLAEAAERASLSTAYLRRLAAMGRLDAQKFGKTWVVRRSSVESFASEERRRGRPQTIVQEDKLWP